jgi:hypothetical protein
LQVEQFVKQGKHWVPEMKEESVQVATQVEFAGER